MSVLHTDIDLLSVTLDYVHASGLPARSADGKARGVDIVELKKATVFDPATAQAYVPTNFSRIILAIR
jgi:hypothetical protein